MKQALKDPITMLEAQPSSFKRRIYSGEEKKKILNFMRKFDCFAVAGLVYDCVKGDCLGMENLGYTDGEFVWSSQDIYHLEKYDAAVTDQFFSKVLSAY